jgi:hypothetical protein
MCDKIKVSTGCGICGADDLLAENLEWYDLQEQCVSDNDIMLMLPYDTALDRMSVVCLDCVIAIRNIKVPTIGELHGDQSCK